MSTYLLHNNHVAPQTCKWSETQGILFDAAPLFWWNEFTRGNSIVVQPTVEKSSKWKRVFRWLLSQYIFSQAILWKFASESF